MLQPNRLWLTTKLFVSRLNSKTQPNFNKLCAYSQNQFSILYGHNTVAYSPFNYIAIFTFAYHIYSCLLYFILHTILHFILFISNSKLNNIIRSKIFQQKFSKIFFFPGGTRQLSLIICQSNQRIKTQFFQQDSKQISVWNPIMPWNQITFSNPYLLSNVYMSVMKWLLCYKMINH